MFLPRRFPKLRVALSAASFIVALAMLIFCIRSHWYYTEVARYADVGHFPHGFFIELNNGILTYSSIKLRGDFNVDRFWTFDDASFANGYHSREEWFWWTKWVSYDWRWFGFGFSDQSQTGISAKSVSLPFYLAALLFIPSALQARRLLRERRIRRASLCLTCGYDLRASPGRCPECGTVHPSGHTQPIDTRLKS